MIQLIERLKSRDYRYEVIIKLILTFLFLMFSQKFLQTLPANLGTVLPKIFKNSTISLMVILLIINWLVDPSILEKLKKGLTNKFFIVCFIYWLLHVVGLLYSSNTKEASFIIEKKLSLLFLPFIFASIQIEEESKLRIYKWFVCLLIFFSVTCLIYGFNNYLNTGDIKMFSLEFSLYIDIHRVVMSMYLTLGTYFVFELFSKKKISFYFLLVYLLISGVHVLLMASRLYMVVYVGFVYFLFYKYIPSKKIFYIASVCMIFLVISSIVVMFTTNKLFKSQIETIFTGKKTDAAYTNGVSERQYQWDAATALIKRHPFIGVGQGDVVDSLVKEYENMKWDIGYTHRYHAHNQYLQSFIGLGILGLLSLIAMIFYPFIFYKETPIEAKICSVLFGISMLTDNHTELQQSIIFMFLWLGMFINLYPKKESKSL